MGLAVGGMIKWYEVFYDKVLRPMYYGYWNYMESFRNPSRLQPYFGF